MKTLLRLACIALTSFLLTGCETPTNTDTSYLTRRFKRACDTCKCLDFNPATGAPRVCIGCGHDVGTHTRHAL